MRKLERNKKVCRRRREFPKLFFLDNLVVNFYHLSVAIEQDVFHDSEVFLPTIFMGGEIKWNFYASLMGDVKLVFPLSQSFLKTLVFSPLKHLSVGAGEFLKMPG